MPIDNVSLMLLTLAWGYDVERIWLDDISFGIMGLQALQTGQLASISQQDLDERGCCCILGSGKWIQHGRFGVSSVNQMGDSRRDREDVVAISMRRGLRLRLIALFKDAIPHSGSGRLRSFLL